MQRGTGEPCLNATLKMQEIKGGTVVLGRTGWPCEVSAYGRFVFTRFWLVCVCFCVFVWEMCLGCKLGQMATLALIPNDLSDSTNDQDKLSFVDFEK